MHIVVLSGMNITILANFSSKITSFMPKAWSLIATMTVIVGFVTYVGPEAPLVRAAIMGIIALMAVLTGRKNIPIYSLILSFIVIALIYPHWLGQLSFQLSFLATLGIILFYPHSFHIKHPVKRFIFSELAITFSAMAFTTPLLFYHFRQISLIAPLSNLLVSFLLAPIMFIGLISLILYTPIPFVSKVLIYVLYPLLFYIAQIIHSLAQLKFASVHF